MSSDTPIGIGLIGCGTVGQGVLRLLEEQGGWYAQRLGRPLEVRRVLVRDTEAPRLVRPPAGTLTDNPDDLFDDPDVAIVIEAAGGLDPVGGYIKRALERRQHVVTANKALLAANGVELFALARKQGVSIAFEASCGGGIPILSSLKFGLAANRIEAIYGILNGTSNYVLTQMTEANARYTDALADAKACGYAEADPTLDVTGADAAQKLAIIASLAFSVSVHESDVDCEGIDSLSLEDIAFGSELGYRIKLLAIAERRDTGLALRVQPCFIDTVEPLAQVRDAFNALSVYGHAVGHTMFYGHGAGQMPTASAVVGDLLNVAGGWYPKAFEAMRLWPDQSEPIRLLHPDELEARHYLRIDVKDQTHVMSRIAAILGDHGISISAVIQRESDDPDKQGYVPLVITTHHAGEGWLTRAADRIAELDTVRARPTCIRIVEPPRG